MIGLWVALALAGDLPEGVTSAPVARELVKPKPASVGFAIEGRPEIEGERLIVRGVLANDGKKPAAVYLEAGGTLTLEPRGATPVAPAPERSRSPEEWVLPPGARVPFEATLELSAWTWPEDAAEVGWRFGFWDDPATGTLPGRLSPPK